MNRKLFFIVHLFFLKKLLYCEIYTFNFTVSRGAWSIAHGEPCLSHSDSRPSRQALCASRFAPKVHLHIVGLVDNIHYPETRSLTDRTSTGLFVYHPGKYGNAPSLTGHHLF